MRIFTPPSNGSIYDAVNQLHKDLPDTEIIANYTSLANDLGYHVVEAHVDRTNTFAPSLHVSVHPRSNPKALRSFTILLLANTANIGVVFEQDAISYMLVRTQDKAGYLSAVSVPGGHKELADRNIDQTGRRELMEEVSGIHIPGGSTYWVSECTSVSLCNNATNTDTEVMLWINPAETASFIASIDWDKWQALKVVDAPRVLTHGSSKPVGLTALLFHTGAGDHLGGTHGVI